MLPHFRENVKIMHEVGNEKEDVFDKNNIELPTVDPITEAYRPGSRALNYRSEPFMDRLTLKPHEKAHSYSSTIFGDPATIIPQGYLGDATKFRVVHGGAEVFHIYHLHGGGDRWRMNPEADPDNWYGDTGLHKTPVEVSQSDRVDAVNTGPGESFNAEIEGGAGGVQQAAGDFLFHCHIAEHYPSGMWGIWRVFDTLQPDLAPLPDREIAGEVPPTAVTSAELIGKTMPNGTVITAENLANWITPQIPPQGVAIGDQDASVWDWTVDNTDLPAPVYLGEPEPTTAETPNFTEGVPGHFASQPNDIFVGNRPVILFNPVTGRPAFPMLRPHLERRPPFAPNLHSGAPGLGDTASRPADPESANPWLDRPDGLCPTDVLVKKFNVVAVGTTVDVTPRQERSRRHAVHTRHEQGCIAQWPDQEGAPGNSHERRRLRRNHPDIGGDGRGDVRRLSQRSRCTSTTCSSTRPAPTAPRRASTTSTPSARTRSRTPGLRSPLQRVPPRSRSIGSIRSTVPALPSA